MGVGRWSLPGRFINPRIIVYSSYTYIIKEILLHYSWVLFQK